MNFNEYVRKFFEFSLFLVVATMPFHLLANSVAIILLSFAWLLEGNFSLKIKLIMQRPLIVIFFIFFLLFLLGMLHTSNIEFGIFNLQKKISLFVFPLIIGTSISFNEKIKETALFVFVVSCFAASLLCCVNGLFYFISFKDSLYLLHEKLSSVINFHPPYFAMYLSFSIFIIFECIRRDKFILNHIQKKILVVIAFFFFCFIILLSARTALVFLFLIFMTREMYFLYKKRKLMIGIIGLLSMLGVTIFLISQSAYLKDRFVKPLSSDISAIDGGKETGLSIRLVKWKCSMEGIAENPLVGTGTGDAVDYLVKCYEKKKFWGMYPQYRFNSHNQYLETTLTLGVPGLICFLLCIMVPFLSAWRKSKYLLLSFITLFCFCSLTESLLERQQGIVFFTFFISLFSFCKEK